MLIAGTILLFWNEGRTVKTTRMLKEAQGVCIELGDIQQIDAEKNGKMIHASGFAGTGCLTSRATKRWRTPLASSSSSRLTKYGSSSSNIL